MSKTLMVLCPVCSGLLQVTRVIEVYYTYRNGTWETVDAGTTDIRYYCENDCVLDPEKVNLPAFPSEDPRWLQQNQLLSN